MKSVALAVKAIDLATLRLFVGADDEAAVLDFLARFFARLDADMKRMRDTIALQRWAEAARLAHQMRSSALAIGASGFALLCTSFEKMALNSGERQVELRFGAMERSFDDVRSAVSSICL
jgi:HPt (histidine-containing phosphotransfer) domain-containing protein